MDVVGSGNLATEVFSIQRPSSSLLWLITAGRITDHINKSCSVFVTWEVINAVNDKKLP